MADSDGSVGGMVSLCVCESHPAHKVRQVSVAMRPQEQVPVVAHNTISAKPHSEQRRTIGQDFLKGQKVVFIAKNPQTSIGTIEYMVNIPT